MKSVIAVTLASALGLAPFAAFAQDAAPMKSERAMPDSNAKAGMAKKKKSERAMTSNAKTEKAKPKGSERAMDNSK